MRRPKKRAAKAKTVQVVVPKAHYTLFNATREEMPEVIVVNDALLSFRHPEIFPWHLRVRIQAQKLAKNGMPTSAESKLLFKIGDEIEKLMARGRSALGAKNALFLARSTWNELRELLFQVHDPEVAHTALQRLLHSRKWPRAWDYEMHQDPDWKEAGYVFALFPLAKGHNS